MKYQDFVKVNFHKLPADMKPTEKIKKIAAAWRDRKGSGGDATGGGIGTDVGHVVDTVLAHYSASDCQLQENQLKVRRKRARGRQRVVPLQAQA